MSLTQFKSIRCIIVVLSILVLPISQVYSENSFPTDLEFLDNITSDHVVFRGRTEPGVEGTFDVELSVLDKTEDETQLLTQLIVPSVEVINSEYEVALDKDVLDQLVVTKDYELVMRLIGVPGDEFHIGIRTMSPDGLSMFQTEDGPSMDATLNLIDNEFYVLLVINNSLAPNRYATISYSLRGTGLLAATASTSETSHAIHALDLFPGLGGSAIFSQGDIDIQGNMNLTAGDADIQGNVFVSDDVDIQENLTVGMDATMQSNLTVNQNLNVNQDLNVNQNLNVSQNLDVTQNANVAGNLSVSGTATFANDAINAAAISDGPGSGLNADQLDGKEAADFVEFDADGNLTVPGEIIVQGTDDSTIAGKLGVGTTTPTARIHVVESAGSNAAIITEATNAKSVASLQRHGVTNNGDFVGTFEGLGSDSSSAIVPYGEMNVLAIDTNAASADGAITFKTRQNNNFLEAMRIDQVGNVGIGTSNPQAKLDVNGTIETASIKFPDDSEQTTAANNFWDGDAEGIYYDQGTVDIGETNSSSSMLNVAGRAANPGQVRVVDGFNDATSIMLHQTHHANGRRWFMFPRMDDANNLSASFHFGMTDAAGSDDPNIATKLVTISEAGSLGIGETNPVQELDVNGSAIIGPSREAGVGPNLLGTLSLFDDQQDTDIVFHSMGNNLMRMGIDTNAGEDIFTITGHSKKLKFKTTSAYYAPFDTGSDVVTIDLERGRLGIGVSDPDEALDVNGTAKVSGFQLTSNVQDGRILRSDANGVGNWQNFEVTSEDIVDGTIKKVDMSDNSVGGEEIINDSIMGQDIFPGAIGTREIFNGGVKKADLDNDSVGGEEIINESIMGEDIFPGAIGTREIFNGSIINEDIHPEANIAAAKINRTGLNADLLDDIDSSGFAQLTASRGLHIEGNTSIGPFPPGSKELTVSHNKGNVGILVKNTNPLNLPAQAEIVFDRLAAGNNQIAAVGMDDSTRDFYIWVNGKDRINIDHNGNVGIASKDAFARLEVEAQLGDGKPAARLQSEDVHLVLMNEHVPEYAYAAAVSPHGLPHYNNRSVLAFQQRELDGRWTADKGVNLMYMYERFDGQGNGLGVGDVVVTGSISSGGADLAEMFPMSEEDIEPGMVVSIDPDNPGQLKASDEAYDKKVAGIISGANNLSAGMVLTGPKLLDEEISEEMIAMSGRVYCYADASNGEIQPGDLLTTSDIPGHVMKVTDSSRAHGAIIGKAMTGLESGQDLILVLVNLH